MMRQFSGSATPVAPIASVLVVLATLLVPAVAQATTKQYVLPHPKREHCRAHYAKKAETVKKREHGRTVKAKKTFCVYVATKKAPVKATTPATATPAPTTVTPSTPVAVVTLDAHLDPSFTQDPSNPLAVTYSYSASATETINGVTSPASNLPSGVLNLYSEGLLKCSMNVGGSITSGECLIVYTQTGAHTVVVQYLSGTNSATTGNEMEMIEPFSTTTKAEVVRQSCETLSLGQGEACTYLISVSVVGQTGSSLTQADGPVAINLEALASYEISGVRHDEPARWEATPPATEMACTVSVVQDVGLLHPYSPDCWISGSGPTVEQDMATSWTITATFAGSAGWTASTSAPQEVTP